MDIGVNAMVFYEVVSGKYQELMSFQSSCKYIYKTKQIVTVNKCIVCTNQY